MRTKIREYVWLSLAIFCIAAAIHQTFKLGFSESYVFFIFAVMAFLIYYIRRTLRLAKKD
ncbi:MAG TPA: hypothetical protein PK252_10095 [Bacteroidales bacterium]|nr:hypothetical protein [Bacteroidales bacterium]